MSKLSRLFTPFVAGALVAVPALALAAPWEIDASHSRLGFSVRHMMVSNTRGQFDKFGGTIDLDDKDPTKSTVDLWIDTASINTADAKRDEHLRNADFFDVAKFPKMTFKSTKIEKLGADKYKVTGNLTIKDATKPVVLTVEGPAKAVKDPWGGMRTGATASGTLNRKDFKLTYNSVLEGGGIAIGEEVKLDLEVELTAKK